MPTFGTLHVDRDGLRELQDGRAVVKLAWQELHDAQLEYGRVEERIVPQLLFATAVSAVGLVALAYVVRWLMGRTAASRLAAMVCLLPFGGWMFRHALRKGWYVRVRAPRGSRKLAVAAALSEGQQAQLRAALTTSSAGV